MRFTLCWMNGKQIFAASERSARWRALLNSAGKARSLLSGPLRPSGVPHGLRRAKGRAGHCGPAHLKAGLCPETGVRVSAKKENCGTRSALRGGETSRPHAWRALSLIRSGGVCRARKAIQITGKQDEHLRLDPPLLPLCPLSLGAPPLLPCAQDSSLGGRLGSFSHPKPGGQQMLTASPSGHAATSTSRSTPLSSNVDLGGSQILLSQLPPPRTLDTSALSSCWNGADHTL